MSEREVYVWALEKQGLRMAVAALLSFMNAKLIEEWKAGEGTTFKVVPRDEQEGP